MQMNASDVAVGATINVNVVHVPGFHHSGGAGHATCPPPMPTRSTWARRTSRWATARRWIRVEWLIEYHRTSGDTNIARATRRADRRPTTLTPP
jgi:hypothetical protein